MAKIMVVDDNKDICDTLKTMLEKKGYKTAVAYDGKEFLAKASRQKPDLVLLDVMMPGLNTRDILKGLEERGLTDLRIMLVTVVRFSDEEIRSLMDEFTIVDYVTKPFDVPRLIALVSRHLK